MPLPYVHIPDLHLGPVTIHPFGVLVATGVLIGSSLAIRRAFARGLDRAKMESLIGWVLLFGFIISHILDVLMYRPREALEHPLELVMVTRGISSYGGFIGATIGALGWRFKKKERILPYVDQIAAVFPISWIFGRAGCSVAHDHIGKLSSSPLAVAFPNGARFDLGLLELFATIPIVIIVLWFARKPRPEGAILGLLCVLYAPVRFPLDALRAVDIINADARYAGLTPAQWLSIVLGMVGMGLLVRAYRRPAEPPPPRPVVADAAA